uniref:General transcription and DNA repair factor IIH subunit TFB5 n=1 Tax=Moniliophthora roreri TaxID=221103 RepID=A0A0W0F548_MONRR
MRAVKGVLLTCDPAVKQILLIMNERQHFILEDLDDNHLVIKADEEYRVRRELEAEGVTQNESKYKQTLTLVQHAASEPMQPASASCFACFTDLGLTKRLLLSKQQDWSRARGSRRYPLFGAPDSQ